MSNANDRQEGGDHYGGGEMQHWDWAAKRNYDYFQGCITKYIDRHKEKNGLEDLEKARHYLDKYIELLETDPIEAVLGGPISGTEIVQVDMTEAGIAERFEHGAAKQPEGHIPVGTNRKVAPHHRGDILCVADGLGQDTNCLKAGHDWVETAGRLSKTSTGQRMVQTFTCGRCEAQGENP